MQGDMTWGEWDEWVQYASVEPFGEERRDYMLAQLACLYVNAHLGKNDRPKSPVDFMPFSERTHTDRYDVSTPEGFEKWLASMG